MERPPLKKDLKEKVAKITMRLSRWKNEEEIPTKMTNATEKCGQKSWISNRICC
jgi:hypothetical protein